MKYGQIKKKFSAYDPNDNDWLTRSESTGIFISGVTNQRNRKCPTWNVFISWIFLPQAENTSAPPSPECVNDNCNLSLQRNEIAFSNLGNERLVILTDEFLCLCPFNVSELVNEKNYTVCDEIIWRTIESILHIFKRWLTIVRSNSIQSSQFHSMLLLCNHQVKAWPQVNHMQLTSYHHPPAQKQPIILIHTATVSHKLNTLPATHHITCLLPNYTVYTVQLFIVNNLLISFWLWLGTSSLFVQRADHSKLPLPSAQLISSVWFRIFRHLLTFLHYCTFHTYYYMTVQLIKVDFLIVHWYGTQLNRHVKTEDVTSMNPPPFRQKFSSSVS